MHIRLFLCTLPIILGVVSGCKKTDSSGVPAYLYIDKISHQALSGEGTSKQDIKDAWVYVDGQAIGVFELPALVPILEEGNKEIWIYGGIIKDGISTTRTKYPFFKQYVTTNVNLTRGRVDSLAGASSPVLNYYPSSEIAIYEENFNAPSLAFQADALSQGTLVYHTTAGEVFEGNGSGLMELNSTQTFSKFITTQTFPLPKYGKNVYLELHYRTNNEMTIGFQAIQGAQVSEIENLHIRASDGVWKKIYIDFTELVSQQTWASTFKFYVSINKEASNTTVYNLIDNFKVVYAK